VGAGAVAALVSLSMIWAITSWLVWPLVIVLGTSAFAVYTVALVMLGDRFDGANLIAGSAAFAATGGIGGIIGPPIAGAALDAFGPVAIPLSLAAIYLILLLGLSVTGGELIRKPAGA
jgi:hypothetical protein